MIRMRVAAASRGVTAAAMPAGHGLALLADVADRERCDGPPELVIRRKHPVVAMPMLPRRRDEIGEPVQELKWREFDDAAGSRPRGLSAAAGWAADHGQSFQREWRPGAIPQQVLQTLKIAGHIAVDERDPDTRVD